MLGKTLILGDSYSTFQGAIPTGYAYWYPYPDKAANDVTAITETWWYPLFDGKDNILLRNESFSGTTLCNSVRPDHKTEWSFINRFEQLLADGFFENNEPDTVLVFGGTNDFTLDVPRGKLKFDHFSEDDLLFFYPACGYLAGRLKLAFPNAVICWMINSGFSEEFSGNIIKAAEHFGQRYLTFPELETMSGHPSVAGMKQITAAVREFFDM